MEYSNSTNNEIFNHYMNKINTLNYEELKELHALIQKIINEKTNEQN